MLLRSSSAPVVAAAAAAAAAAAGGGFGGSAGNADSSRLIGGPPAPPPDSDEALERYVGRAVGPGAYAEVKELLDELNVFDAQLYAYAAELFQEKLELCELCAEKF